MAQKELFTTHTVSEKKDRSLPSSGPKPSAFLPPITLNLGLDYVTCAQEAVSYLRRLIHGCMKRGQFDALQYYVHLEIQLKSGVLDPATIARQAILHSCLPKHKVSK